VSTGDTGSGPTTVDPHLLHIGELTLHGRVMPASNATFVGEVEGVRVVYKPVAGERPLWDFPDGTLADREVAAYLVSVATGWDVVPLTISREGPHGPGMVQVWQEPDPEQSAVDIARVDRLPAGYLHVFDGLDARDRPVSLVHEDSEPLRRMALFDILVNNADRKGGHVLAMTGGHRYGVDHGVTFHAEDKLRTVLWGWAGGEVPESDLVVVESVLHALTGDLGRALGQLVTPLELASVARRCSRLLSTQRMPVPQDGWPTIPWPPF
jgi:uncharacterized repeat protein (TIGR03843 family)